MSSKCCRFGSKSSVKSENEHLCESSELREEAEAKCRFSEACAECQRPASSAASTFGVSLKLRSCCSFSSSQIRSSTFWRHVHETFNSEVCVGRRSGPMGGSSMSHLPRDRVVGHELSHRLCTSLKAETFSCPLNLFLTSNMYENTARSNNRQRLISPRHSFFSCALVWILVTCSCQQQ